VVSPDFLPDRLLAFAHQLGKVVRRFNLSKFPFRTLGLEIACALGRSAGTFWGLGDALWRILGVYCECYGDGCEGGLSDANGRRNASGLVVILVDSRSVSTTRVV